MPLMAVNDPGPQGAVVSFDRAEAIIAWLKLNRSRINSVGKGSLVFNFAGASVVPEVIEKMEPLPPPVKRAI